MFYCSYNVYNMKSITVVIFPVGGVARWRWVAPIFKSSLMEASLENTLVFSAPPAPRRHPQRHHSIHFG